jgi:hypothetical protein
MRRFSVGAEPKPAGSLEEEPLSRGDLFARTDQKEASLIKELLNMI